MIRKAKKTDGDAIAICLLQAMKEIVYVFTGEKDPDKATAFMRHFTAAEAKQYSYQNCFVAEKEGKIIAAVAVYDGADLHRLRQPVLDFIQHQYARTLQPEDETGPGEMYIDSPGVLPSWRGTGIGTQLLGFVADEYVQKQKQTLGLLVDADNAGARRLYLLLGLTQVGEKTLLGKRWRFSRKSRIPRIENSAPTKKLVGNELAFSWYIGKEPGNPFMA